MLPLLHDLAGERVLVVGGGPVAARKARHFAAEATVVVFARAFEDTGAFPDGAALVRVALAPAGLAPWLARVEPALVVAATDDEGLNEAVAAAGRDAGALVNRADRGADRGGEPGDVAVPATARAGDVVIGVGTNGRSPALAGYLRERVEEAVGELEHAEEMAALTGELRAELHEDGLAAAERHAAIRAVVRSREVWTAFHTPGANSREIAADVISDVTGDSP